MYSRNIFRRCLYLCSVSRKSANQATIQLLPLDYYHQLINLTTFSLLSSYRQKFAKGKQNNIQQVLFQEARRTTATSTMAQDSGTNSREVLSDVVTVIRYQPGDERFQMQMTLHTGKVFNFDRSTTETISNVVARMVANIGKKVKTFNGTVKFLLESGDDASRNDETTEMEKLLLLALSTSSSFKVQVDEHVYKVVLNPPEVYAAKFFSICMPTFPILPYRMETSSNFDKTASLYKWEFSKEKPSPGTPPKLKKKSVGDVSNSKSTSSWVECGSSLVFTPEPDMEGGYLRFSCTPSNGKMFGKPFSVVLPNPIAAPKVNTYLYQERLTRLSPKREDGDCLRVVSYNVLADTYATPEWFISSPKDSLDVGYRLPILSKEIKAYQADLICLQEVDEKYFEGNFEPFLSMEGYKGRHTSKIGNTKEGIATFHNPAKLTEIEFRHYVIFEYMKTLPLWERLRAISDDFTQRLEDRNTVFHLSVFQVNHCAKKTILAVGNVHLYFHPDADHIRLLQTIVCVDLLEKCIRELKAEHADQRVMVMFCGDFNCTPPFSSYRLLTTGQIDESDEDWTSHPEEKISPGISIQHSLNLTNSHPGEELTNITTCFEGCLDYILYQAEHFTLISTCPPPKKDEIAALTKVAESRKVSLPNFYTPSDHLPLIADFKIKS